MTLPPLPSHRHSLNSGTFAPLYTADQMRAYAEQVRAAERERCVEVAKGFGYSEESMLIDCLRDGE